MFATREFNLILTNHFNFRQNRKRERERERERKRGREIKKAKERALKLLGKKWNSSGIPEL